MNKSIYYWGQPDTTVSFCEEKYTKNAWIAEYYNTISAMSYILFGAFFLATKIKHIGISMIILGLSTMTMHGTLRYYGQWLDECSILFISYSGIRLLNTYFTNRGFIYLAIYYYFIRNYFILFFLMFTTMQLYICHLSRTIRLNKKQKVFIHLYILCFSLGFSCWCIDQFLCHYIQNVPFHAMWHLFTALGMFYGFIGFLL